MTMHSLRLNRSFTPHRLETVHHVRGDVRRASSAQAKAFFVTICSREQHSRSSRYGPAQERPPHLKVEKLDSDIQEPVEAPSLAKEAQSCKVSAGPVHDAIAIPAPNRPANSATSYDATSTKQCQLATVSPLDRVLGMDPSNSLEEGKAHHLKTPRCVHHFDSFSLVQDLEKNGWSENQAIIAMKAVRGLLLENMHLARTALVSKSNVANELYLFRAACSELKTEIQKNRKIAAEVWTTQRSQLQHEVDILGQRLLQETSALKDELKGMSEERKIHARLEERNTQAKIQELNARITIALNSDARGEIESVRWILTRRAAIALTLAAAMILMSLNYSRIKHGARQAANRSQQKRVAQEAAHTREPPATFEREGTQGLAEEALLAPDGVVGG